ncbi:hypothetical protein DPMN_194814 [Dreissena polymorpha]|uniref:Uncharacterized protein n=1 Tax=Dreissena polymorpha TaxID=45954 RepID=A0A9D3Y5Q3_DREPO|nr:hypothetical protein DPMN_194814 [Dreissena polymorpha]
MDHETRRYGPRGPDNTDQEDQTIRTMSKRGYRPWRPDNTDHEDQKIRTKRTRRYGP